MIQCKNIKTSGRDTGHIKREENVNTYEFSTKLHNRTNAAGQTVEKVRVWLEESTNNRFLSDAGFKRGQIVEIHTFLKSEKIMIMRINDPAGSAVGKRAKVAGKADRALFDITRNSDQMPAAFHPKNNSKLIATIEAGLITIQAKG